MCCHGNGSEAHSVMCLADLCSVSQSAADVLVLIFAGLRKVLTLTRFADVFIRDVHLSTRINPTVAVLCHEIPVEPQDLVI